MIDCSPMPISIRKTRRKQSSFNSTTGRGNIEPSGEPTRGTARAETTHRNLRIGDLPGGGEWVRLEVAASAVGLKAGAKLNGWAFTQFGGTVHWDNGGQRHGRSARSGATRVAGCLGTVSVRRSSILPCQRRSKRAPGHRARKSARPTQTTQLTRHYLQHVNPTSRERFAEPLEQQGAWKKELAATRGGDTLDTGHGRTQGTEAGSYSRTRTNTR